MELNDYKKILELKKTPIYVFDSCGFKNNYQKLERAMKSVYPRYQISYSYKTNYTPYICELVKSFGGYAEVVSDMEYMLAKKIGYSNDKIVYNGPSKGDLLEEHIVNGGIVNIDSYDEAVRIILIVQKHPNKFFKVGVRVNLDVGSDFISRFGMVPGSHDFEKTVDIIKSVDNIKLVGLHCHISRNRGIEAWAKRSSIMIQVADEYIEGIPEYISLGSGMFAEMAEDLSIQFGSVPTYDDYANITMAPFAKHYKEIKPIVFTEPGTTVVARYLNFLSKVISIKEVRQRSIANMDGSINNLGEICTLKKLPIKKISEKKGDFFDAIDLMGYTCLEQDLMYSDYSGELSVGDVLVFENVGGYSVVSKPQFIKPNCSMVVLEKSGNIKEIMREETFNDVFSKFYFNMIE